VIIAPGLRSSLVAASLLVAAPAWSSDEGPLDPPILNLPESVNGTIRLSQQGQEAGRIDRLRDVFPAIRACWRPPAGERGTGLQVTLRVSFKRSGAVLGRPAVTYFQDGGSREARERFLTAVLETFARCTPLPFTAGFGAAIAGRPFTFRFVDDRSA
jgi:hypothetical protein